jgi:hypothetical protein
VLMMEIDNLPGLCLLRCRIAEVTDDKKQIPFATELESGKWLHDSDM